VSASVVDGFFKSNFGVVSVVVFAIGRLESFDIAATFFTTDVADFGGVCCCCCCMVDIFDDWSGGKSDSVVVKCITGWISDSVGIDGFVTGS
jgi:hypothetical protein